MENKIQKINKNQETQTNKEEKTLAITGGGTMGHISPSLALLEELKKYYDKIIYIGSKNSMEEKKAKEYNLPFYSVDTIKFDRLHLLKNLKIPFVLFKARKQAKQILQSNNVEKLFSKGGYVSVPVILASQKLKIANILHESDMTLGLANKISAIKANKVFVSTNKAKDTLSPKMQNKTIVTGIPVAKEFNNNKEVERVKKLKSVTNKKIMVITGGSQGAKYINKFIRENLIEITQNYYIYHIVGKGNIDTKISNTNYKQIEFVNNISDYFKASDIIISRAGATTIFEALKCEAMLISIPLPKSKYSRGDQVENAKYFNSLGLIDFIEQDSLDMNTLSLALKNIEKNKDKRLKYIKDFNNSTLSNAKIAEIIAKT